MLSFFSRIRLLVVSILFAQASCAVYAEPINVGRMAVPIKQGFRFSVEMESVPGNGYQPVLLNFAPTGRVFVRDRNLTIAITPGDQMQTQIDFTYRCEIQLPQNGTGVSSVQSIPYYFPWDQMHVQVFEDDKPLKGCATVFGINNPRQQPLEHRCVGIVLSREIDQLLQQNSDIEKQQRSDYRLLHLHLAARPRMPHATACGDAVLATIALLSESGGWSLEKPIQQPAAWQQCPDVRTLRTAFSGPIPTDSEIRRLDHSAARQLAERLQPAEVQFRLLDVNAMPEQWLALSQLDVLLIAAPLLQRIESQPLTYQALQDWLANGGNLWVYATKQADCKLFDRLALQSISTMTVPTGKNLIRSLDLNESNDDSFWDYNAYNGPMRMSTTYSQAASPDLNSSRSAAYEATKKSGHPFAATDRPGDLAGMIRMGRFGLGTVTAIDEEDPFPQSYQFWTTIVRNVGSDQLDWVQRNGINVPAGNSHFWSWLIASVGQPPVKSFITMNTLFVLIVGPACYLYLRRRQRLYLLFFIAPLLALIVTGSLVAYAYLGDGVRTRARVRQITWVDSEAEYAVTQGRQTYFAVTESRKGLVFPDSVAVYPVMRGTIRGRYRYRQINQGSAEGTITSSEDQTHFDGCFLPPRSQVQMLVMHPVQTTDTVEFSVADNEFAVTNRFPFSLRELVLRDQAGNLWRTRNVAAGATASLSKLAINEPLDMDIAPLDPMFNGPNLRSTRDPWGRYVVGSQASLLEESLEDWLSLLPTERFMAVADEPYQELLGTDNTEMTESNHVIMGRLP